MLRNFLRCISPSSAFSLAATLALASCSPGNIASQGAPMTGHQTGSQDPAVPPSSQEVLQTSVAKVAQDIAATPSYVVLPEDIQTLKEEGAASDEDVQALQPIVKQPGSAALFQRGAKNLAWRLVQTVSLPEAHAAGFGIPWPPMGFGGWLQQIIGSWWWSYPEHGFQIEVKPSKTSYKAGDLVHFDCQIHWLKGGLFGYQSLPSSVLNGVDITASFPDAVHPISLNVNRSNGKCSFTAVTPLKADDANVLNILITRKDPPSRKFQDIQKTQAKLERWAASLTAQIQWLKTVHHYPDSSLAGLVKLRDQLLKVSGQVDAVLGMNPDILAEARFPVWTDNQVPQPAHFASLISGFRFAIDYAPGSAVQGMKAEVRVAATNLRAQFPNIVWASAWGSKQDGILKVKWKGSLLHQTAPTPFELGSTLSYEFTTDKLLATGSNEIEVELLRVVSKDSKGKPKTTQSYGSLDQTITVAPDTVAPEWQLGPRQYLRELPPLAIRVTDRLGLVDPETFLAQFTSTVPNPNGGPDDVPITTTIDFTSQLTPVVVGEGQSYDITGDLGHLAEGDYSISLSIKDLAGNKAQPNPGRFQFSIDRTSPRISSAGDGAVPREGFITNQPTLNLPLTIFDWSPTTTTVRLGGLQLLQTTDKELTPTISLAEGFNVIEVTSIDAALNSSQITFVVELDTTPPVLSNLTPADDANVYALTFQAGGQANEALSAVSLNGNTTALAIQGNTFSGFFSAQIPGQISLKWIATDLAGNSTEVNTTARITLVAINPALLSVSPLEGTNNVRVTGAPGATPPNSQITVSSNLFNSASTVSAADGSFAAELGAFTTATVTSYDPVSDLRGTASVQFNLTSTQLSGTVLDTDGRPLKDALVSLLNTDVTPVRTNESGIFVFQGAVTGSHRLIVSGQDVIDPCQDCGARKFTTASMALNIGLNQHNVLQRPVYLEPWYHDGSEVVVTKGQETTVTSVHAPEVSLKVPANALPDEIETVAISMSLIPADRAVMPPPDVVRPTTVIGLEPSGLVFKEPVELSVPNTNELPAGMNLVVLSLGSDGVWAFDGVAAVTQDRTRVVTKPGQGIRHFSQVFMSVMGPRVSHFGSKDKPGASISDGALTAEVSLASWLSLGQEVKPTLKYSTAWAKPSTVVTNVFSIPEDVELNQRAVGEMQEGIFGLDLGFGAIEVEHHVVPEKITAQFRTEDIDSGVLEFKSNLPKKVTLSFGMDLSSLSSGLHPYVSHFEVHLKDTIVTTEKVYSRRYGLFGPIEEDKDARFSRSMDWRQVFPQDLSGPLVTQNKTQSAFGRGWQLAGVQQILNPGSEQVVIEEGDGSTTLYAVDNLIETIFDGNNYSNRPSQVTLDEGVSFDHWPNAYVGLNDPGTARVARVDLTAGPLSGYTDYGWNGSLGAWLEANWWEWHGFFGGGQWKHRYRQVFHRRTMSGIAALPGGTVFSVSEATSELNRIFAPGAGYARLAGSVGILREFDAGSMGQAVVLGWGDAYCMTSESQGNLTGRSCGGWSGVLDEFQRSYHGEVPYPGNSVGGFLNLNVPKGIAVHPSEPIVAIADWGNNRVVTYNYNTGQSKRVAGNEGSGPRTDGVDAKNSTLVHPLAVTYDKNGRLYIATSEGLIRKVELDDRISTIAGNLDPNQNPILGNTAPANRLLLTNPRSLLADEQNNLYIADTGNHRVLKLDMSEKVATLVAGGGLSAPQPPQGDGIPAALAGLIRPNALGWDDQGNLLISDAGNKRIRRVIFAPQATTKIAFLPLKQDHSRLYRNGDGTWERTLRGGIKVLFDNQGLQMASIDNLGRTTNFGYTNGLLTSITDPVNRTMTLTYSSDGLLNKISAGLHETSFSYQDGQLIAVIHPDGSSREFVYDETTGLLKKERKETFDENVFIEYDLNAWNQLSWVKNPDGATTTFENGRAASILSDVPGSEPRIMNGQDGNSTEEQLQHVLRDSKGNETTLAENSSGQISKVAGKDGSVAELSYDAEGRTVGIKLTDAQNKIVANKTMAYNTCGDLVGSKDLVTNIKTSRKYDVDIDPLVGCAMGLLLEETNALDETARKTYFANGLLKSVVSGSGLAVEYIYTTGGVEPAGLVKTKTIKSSDQAVVDSVTFNYNSQGNLIKTTDAFGETVQERAYVSGVVSAIVNAKGLRTEYGRDEMDRLTSVKEAIGTAKERTTSYAYHSASGGLIKSVTDPHGSFIHFAYDSMGRLWKKTDRWGGVTELKYDISGELGKEIDPIGNEKIYHYGDENRLKRKELWKKTSSGSLVLEDAVDLVYNGHGKLSDMTDSDSGLRFGYTDQDSLQTARSYGRGDAVSLPDVTLTYSQDALGRTETMNSPLGTTVYHYNSLSQYTGLTNPLGETFVIGYDTSGRMSKLSRTLSEGQAVETNFTYGSGSFLSGIVHKKALSPDAIVSYSYSPDAIRNIAAITVTGTGLAGMQQFGYDGLNQLIESNRTFTSGTPTNESFDFDAIGNRISDQGGSFAYAKNGNDKNLDRIHEDYRYIYVFDQNGNMITRTAKAGFPAGETMSFIYSVQNQLTQVRAYDAGNTLIRESFYRYDPQGRRIEKRVIDHQTQQLSLTRRYVYDSNEILAEYNGENQALAYYTHSGAGTDDVLAVRVTGAGKQAGLATNEGSYAYLKDHQGSVKHITDNNGAVLMNYLYGAFGTILGIQDAQGADLASDSLPVNTPYTYTGREFDRETGLYYYRARYYDSFTGRFLQKDPHPGNPGVPASVVNGYSYGANNPIYNNDPSGRILPILAVIGLFIAELAVTAVMAGITTGVITGLIYGAVAFCNGGDFGAAFLKGFGTGFVSGAATGGAGFVGGYIGAVFNASQVGAVVAGGLFNGAYGAIEGSANGGGWPGGVLGFFGGFVSGAIGTYGGYSAHEVSGFKNWLEMFWGGLLSPQVPGLEVFLSASLYTVPTAKAAAELDGTLWDLHCFNYNGPQGQYTMCLGGE